MMAIEVVDAKIAALSADLSIENERIASAIAAKQIGDGSGYWKQRHDLACRLRIAAELRAALAEALA